MWRSRSKNDNNNNSPKVRRIPSNPDFNHQSFKNIDTLFPHATLSDLNHDQPSSSSSSSSSQSHNYVKSDVVKRPSVFHRVNLASKITRAFSARPKPDPEQILSQPNDAVPAAPEQPSNLEKPDPKPVSPAKPDPNITTKPDPKITIPGAAADQRVVVYMTSLRVVRSTFEACRTVRSILQGFRVPIDERDLSMDSAFFDEIRKIMAQIGQGRRDDKRVELPKVFIGGRYIGGADEVVELHEIGELKKFVKGLPAVTPGGCKYCGGFRFILCLECSGSHKCHTEKEGFMTCTVCNENGLIRCPSCLSS